MLSEHVQAAHRTGWTLAEMDEGLVDDAWIAKKPKWERYRFHPVSFAVVWRKQRVLANPGAAADLPQPTIARREKPEA